MKKLFIQCLMLIFFCTPVITSATLYQYYDGDLPSIEERVEVAEEYGITNYTGTYAQNVALEGYLSSEMGMLGAILPEDGYDTYLTSSLTAVATDIFVNVLPTVTESIFTIFSSDGVTVKEKVYCTGQSSSPNKLTGCARGLSSTPTGNVIDETAGTGSSHSKNARIAITDNINFVGKALNMLAGNQKTSSTEFIIGTGASTTIKVYLQNTNATGTSAWFGFNGGKLQFSEDSINTYNFTDGGSGITASSTLGLVITGGEIGMDTTYLSNNYLDLGGFDHAFKDVYASGTTRLTVTEIDGLITFGSSGLFASNILPNANNTIDIGAFGSAFGSIYASGTLYVGDSGATSTILSGLDVGVLNVSSSTATSTFANGIKLNGGCFKDIDGNCLVDPVTQYHMLASDVLQWSDDATHASDTTEGTYVLSREMYIYLPNMASSTYSTPSDTTHYQHTIRAKYDARSTDGTTNVRTRLDINGESGTAHAAITSDTFATFSEDYILNTREGGVGIKFELRVQEDGGSAETSVETRNLRIYYTLTEVPNHITTYSED